MDGMGWCPYLAVSPLPGPAAHAVGGDAEVGVASHAAGVAKAAATASAAASAAALAAALAISCAEIAPRAVAAAGAADAGGGHAAVWLS